VSQSVLSEIEPLGVNVCLQYLAAVDEATFAPAETLGPGSRILIAAYVNQVRLIDNMAL
jgi:pantothenate synthetase